MVHNPHDALVKAVLAHPEHARGVLQSVVPAPLVEAVDWTALTLRPGRYVDVALREQFSDLLFSATWRGGDEVFVYFLFEHQSSPPTAPTDGEAAVLLRLVRQRFGNAVNGYIERRIATASIAQLDTWATRIFSAATLSELLAD